MVGGGRRALRADARARAAGHGEEESHGAGGGYRVVIAGHDADAIAEVIRKLGDLEAFNGPGVLLKIDQP